MSKRMNARPVGSLYTKLNQSCVHQGWMTRSIPDPQSFHVRIRRARAFGWKVPLLHILVELLRQAETTSL